MRIAILADTHLPRGARRLPEECLRLLERADLALHAGDFVSLDALRELEQLAPVAGVWGNMDEPRLRELLPERRVIEVGGLRIGIVHVPGPARGRHGRLVGMFPGCDGVVYGHTHVPEILEHESVRLVNPGSPTERRRAPARSMAVLTVAAGRARAELVPLP